MSCAILKHPNLLPSSLSQKRKQKEAPAPLTAADQAVLDARTKHNVALHDLKTAVELADVFVYVLDARHPLAYRSSEFEAMLSARPKAHRRVILLLNKAGGSMRQEGRGRGARASLNVLCPSIFVGLELVPVETLQRWITYFEKYAPHLPPHLLPPFPPFQLPLPFLPLSLSDPSLVLQRLPHTRLPVFAAVL